MCNASYDYCPDKQIFCLSKRQTMHTSQNNLPSNVANPNDTINVQARLIRILHANFWFKNAIQIYIPKFGSSSSMTLKINFKIIQT